MSCRSGVAMCASVILIALAVGCASLRNDQDALASYEIPGEIEADGGFFSKPTEKISAAARRALGYGPNEQTARREYESAMQAYRDAESREGDERRKMFASAAKSFGKAATRWPGSSIEEDSLFYRAESHFFADECPKAEENFAQLAKKYPSTKYVDLVSKRRFQIAEYWLKHHQQDKDLPLTPNLTSRALPSFDKFGHAIRVLENIRLDDPTGEIADDATMLAATACFQAEKYYRADEFLTDLRRSFPGSPHQFEAHLLGLQCKIKLYQGPSYDSGPLDSAEELVKQMRRQFPTESREHEEYLATAFKDIRMNHAIREMSLARYRDNRREYLAARTQYAKVIRDYSDTSLAGDAELRLAQLDGKPDLPPQRMQAIAKLFPEDEDEIRPLIANNPAVSRR